MKIKKANKDCLETYICMERLFEKRLLVFTVVISRQWELANVYIF